MARVYATPQELGEFTGDYPPVNSLALLTRASQDVDQALIGAWYDTDDDHLPTDPDIADALRAAVCAQVDSWWPRDKTGARLPAGRMMAIQPPPERWLCPEAAQALRVAPGLLPVSVRTYR